MVQLETDTYLPTYQSPINPPIHRQAGGRAGDHPEAMDNFRCILGLYFFRDACLIAIMSDPTSTRNPDGTFTTVRVKGPRVESSRLDELGPELGSKEGISLLSE